MLNLPSEVTGTVNGTTMTANYEYLPDGTKLSTADNSGSGFAYLGSLVYRKDGSSYTFESTDFSGGRIYRDGIGYDAGYFVRDRLGSTRTIVDGSGNIVEQNDYYPFGGRLDNGLSMSATNRYRFSGKEQQTVADVDLLDFGARFYDDEICRWTTVDPLAKKYFGLSPYNYCGNDPVNRFDPDGRTDYFDYEGNFLYNDGADNGQMRAIEAAAYWGIQVVNSYKNYTTEEMNLLLYNSSETVNDAELADKALFSIADHYNDTGYHMSPRTLNREQMKSRNSSDGSAEIFIDIPRCFKSSFYDSSYNLINSIKGHEVDGHIGKSGRN